MLAAYTELRYAQKVKEFLQKKNLLHYDYLPVKELDHIYFAVSKKAAVPNAKVVNTKFSFPERQKQVTVDDLLKGKLTPKEIKKIQNRAKKALIPPSIFLTHQLHNGKK